MDFLGSMSVSNVQRHMPLSFTKAQPSFIMLVCRVSFLCLQFVRLILDMSLGKSWPDLNALAADEHANVGIAIEAAEERKRQLKLLSKLFPDDEPKCVHGFYKSSQFAIPWSFLKLCEVATLHWSFMILFWMKLYKSSLLWGVDKNCREEPVLQPEAASGTEKQLAPKNGVDNKHTKIRLPKTKLSVQPKLVSKPTTVPTGSDDNVPIDEDKVDSEEDPWMQGDDSIFFQSQSPSPLGAASDASKWSRLFKAASVKKSSSHSQSREGVFSGILDDFDKDDSAGPVAEPASLDPHLSGKLRSP